MRSFENVFLDVALPIPHLYSARNSCSRFILKLSYIAHSPLAQRQRKESRRPAASSSGTTRTARSTRTTESRAMPWYAAKEKYAACATVTRPTSASRSRSERHRRASFRLIKKKARLSAIFRQPCHSSHRTACMPDFKRALFTVV